MNIGIITINFGRPRVLQLWCAMIRRLREDLQMYIPAVVVSESVDSVICNKYHVTHVTMHQDNDTCYATHKWNRAMQFMRGQGMSNVMILGSDDIISTKSFKRIMEQVEKGYDLVGSNNVYFFAADGKHKGGLINLHGTRMLAPGKTVSSYVLDKVDWNPWAYPKPRNWGMDAIIDKNLKPHVRHSTILSFMEIFDIKTIDNLNKASMWFKKLKPPQDPAKLWGILGEEETQLLKEIMGCR